MFMLLNIVMLALAIDNGDASQQPPAKRYVRVASGYLMVLQQGDSVFNALEQFALAEHIASANFTGMGFVNVTFGYFNFDTKKYRPQDFSDVELASMHGTIAWKEGKPSIHAHGVVGDENFTAHAGHILKAMVSTGSVEIMITPHNKRFERRKDPTLGADVLNLETP